MNRVQTARETKLAAASYLNTWRMPKAIRGSTDTRPAPELSVVARHIERMDRAATCAITFDTEIREDVAVYLQRRPSLGTRLARPHCLYEALEVRNVER